MCVVCVCTLTIFYTHTCAPSFVFLNYVSLGVCFPVEPFRSTFLTGAWVSLFLFVCVAAGHLPFFTGT